MIKIIMQDWLIGKNYGCWKISQKAWTWNKIVIKNRAPCIHVGDIWGNGLTEMVGLLN